MNTNFIYEGECSEVMMGVCERNSVDLVVTSPPYGNLRTYNGYKFDYKKIIHSLYYIMKPGGVVVWVVADETISGGESGESFRQALAFQEEGFKIHDHMIFKKNTCSFPARRTGNRYTQIFENMFVFVKAPLEMKGKPKTANLICDKPNKWAGHTNWGTQTKRQKDGTLKEVKDINPVPEFSPRTNIWEYNVSGGFGHKDDLAYKHPGSFPLELAKDHILTWSNEDDIVLDPMCGSGTTLVAAMLLKRQYIGIDISPEYCKLSEERLKLYTK